MSRNLHCTANTTSAPTHHPSRPPTEHPATTSVHAQSLNMPKNKGKVCSYLPAFSFGECLEGQTPRRSKALRRGMLTKVCRVVRTDVGVRTRMTTRSASLYSRRRAKNTHRSSRCLETVGWKLSASMALADLHISEANYERRSGSIRATSFSSPCETTRTRRGT